MNESQFGTCVICKEVSSCQRGTHNLVINHCGSQEDYFPQCAYDLCDSCIEDLEDWLFPKPEDKEIL